MLYEDPYAPKTARKTRPGIVVPAGRLRRLGATPRALEAYRRWWEGLDTEQRLAATRALAVLTDAQLSARVLVVDEMHDWSAQTVEAWARRQDDREWAANLAMAVEASHNGGARDGLMRKLVTIK